MVLAVKEISQRSAELHKVSELNSAALASEDKRTRCRSHLPRPTNVSFSVLINARTIQRRRGTCREEGTGEEKGEQEEVLTGEGGTERDTKRGGGRDGKGETEEKSISEERTTRRRRRGRGYQLI